MPLALALLPLLSVLAAPQAPTQSLTGEALRSAQVARHVKKEAKAPRPPEEARPAAKGKLWTDGQPILPRPIQPPNIAAMVKTSMPGVVGIIATTAGSASGTDAADPFHDFLEKMYGSGGGGGGEKNEPVRGIGTGFFISASGLVITNGHVVEGASDIQVQIGREERPVKAHVVGRDDPTDVALLQVDAPGPFAVLPLGDSDATDVGEWVVAIGTPFGLSRTVTTGIISFKGRRDVNPSGRPGYYDFIQTDAAINPGNSGGPLLDGRGFVIGINAAVNPSGQGIGFAIPINMVKTIVPTLFEKGYVQRSYMGLSIQEDLTAELAASFGVPAGKGVLVTEITADGPADKAGLKVGDIVTTYDGETLSESWRLRWLTSIAGIGKTVKLGVVREGKEQEVEVTLTERPGVAASAPPKDVPFSSKDPMGLAVEELGEASSDAGAVRVTGIDIRGPAYRVGMREGDIILEVNGKKIDGKRAYTASVGGHHRAGVIRLYVRRGGRPIFFGVKRETPAPSVREASDG